MGLGAGHFEVHVDTWNDFSKLFNTKENIEALSSLQTFYVFFTLCFTVLFFDKTKTHHFSTPEKPKKTPPPQKKKKKKSTNKKKKNIFQPQKTSNPPVKNPPSAQGHWISRHSSLEWVRCLTSSARPGGGSTRGYTVTPWMWSKQKNVVFLKRCH